MDYRIAKIIQSNNQYLFAEQGRNLDLICIDIITLQEKK